jgi:molybdenum cofactor biosynthesis enzyme MoaA
MKLDNIGFYTLTDERARTASADSPLSRCEILVTDACNFRCPYCRSHHNGGHMTWEAARDILDAWVGEGLRNIRFSGGEPTMWPHLIKAIEYVRPHVERVAISTNGSACWDTYRCLLDAGVDDFSVSFDACCSSTGDAMSGRTGFWKQIVQNTERLAAEAYVTVGVVLTDDNIAEVGKIVELACSLGVADVRVIPAAQFGSTAVVSIDPALAESRPVLSYRISNLASGRPFRGLSDRDSHSCHLVLDDMAVKDGKHYPCIIYLREGGEAIGEVGPQMRTERARWADEHDTHSDPICRVNCLDVCVDYNNRCRDFRC